MVRWSLGCEAQPEAFNGEKVRCTPHPITTTHPFLTHRLHRRAIKHEQNREPLQSCTDRNPIIAITPRTQSCSKETQQESKSHSFVLLLLSSTTVSSSHHHGSYRSSQESLQAQTSRQQGQACLEEGRYEHYRNLHCSCRQVPSLSRTCTTTVAGYSLYGCTHSPTSFKTTRYSDCLPQE